MLGYLAPLCSQMNLKPDPLVSVRAALAGLTDTVPTLRGAWVWCEQSGSRAESGRLTCCPEGSFWTPSALSVSLSTGLRQIKHFCSHNCLLVSFLSHLCSFYCSVLGECTEGSSDQPHLTESQSWGFNLTFLRKPHWPRQLGACRVLGSWSL